MRKKISTTIYITQDQNEKLKLLHKYTRVPVAEYVRQGIDMVLQQYAHVIPGHQFSLTGNMEPESTQSSNQNQRLSLNQGSTANPGQRTIKVD